MGNAFTTWEPSPSKAFVSLYILFFSLVYCLFLGLYRILWHPIAKIPGPMLAASKGLYEAYHDIVQGGTFIKQYPSWHQKYGKKARSFSVSCSLQRGQDLSLESDPIMFMSLSWNFTTGITSNFVTLYSLNFL